LRDNLHYTFAGFNFPPTFLDLLLDIGVSHIMFSADYPYGSMAAARAFLEQIPVSAADRAWQRGEVVQTLSVDMSPNDNTVSCVWRAEVKGNDIGQMGEGVHTNRT
jgi:hypothetical protein